jgi:hypothetical protein
MIKEAHDLDVVSNTIEAGMGQWFQSLLTRIPGLPTKEQALKIVAPMVERNPREFEQSVGEISAVLQSAGKEQFSTRLALDMKSLVRSIKTVTDPKVILAIIALMGAFQTADAGKLRDFMMNPSLSKAIKEVKESPDKTREELREERVKRREERHQRWEKIRGIEEKDDEERYLVIRDWEKVKPILIGITNVLNKRIEEKKKLMSENSRRLEIDLLRSDISRLEYELRMKKSSSNSTNLVDTIETQIKSLRGLGIEPELDRIEAIMSRLNDSL